MRTQYLDGWGDLSLLTLGGGGIGQVWGATTRPEAVATVHEAVDAGITLLDLAPSYGDGEAELVVGAAFGGTLPDGVRVTTKYGLNAPPADQVLSLLEHSLDASLRRMRLEQVDVFFLHCSIVPDELAGHISGTPRSLFVERVRPAFEHLVETGKIKAWGITGVTVPSAVLHTLDEDPKPAMVQAITNLMDATGALPHDGEAPRTREIVARAAQHGIGVLGIRALAAGALTDAIDRPVASDAPVMQDFQRAAPFRALAHELGTPAATLAHRYALSMPGITSIVLGVKNRAELREALDAEAAGPLDAETIARVDALGLAPSVS